MSDYDDYHVLSKYTYPGYVRIEGTEDWVTVVELGDGGYEWEEFKVFYSPSQRMYFWHGGAGCSCNSWSDDVHSVGDFENGSEKTAVMSAWERFTKEHSYSFNIEEYLNGILAIKNFTPPTD